MKKKMLLVIFFITIISLFSQLSTSSKTQIPQKLDQTQKKSINKDRDTILNYDDGINTDGIGTGGAYDLNAAIRFEPAQLTAYDNYSLTQIDFFPKEINCEYSIRIWQGTDAGTLLVDQLVETPIVESWNYIPLTSPVTIDASQELWIGYRANTQEGNPLGHDVGPAVAGYGDMLLYEGSWASISTTYGLDYNWNIQAHLTEPSPQDEVIIGTDTTHNAYNGTPSPYGTFYKNFKQQYLYTADEILAAGGNAGSINSIAFEVENVNNCSPMPDYTIRMKHTDQTELTETFEVGTYTQVWYQDNFLPETGWNTHSLSTPFNWDGTSNIIIEIVTSLISGSYTQNASVYYSSTTSNTSLRYRSDTNSAINATSGTLSTNRANIKMSFASGPSLSVIPLAHQFENTEINESSLLQEFTISNSGTEMFTISEIDITGTDQSQFLLSDNNTYPVNLNVGESIVVDVTFSPLTVGLKNAGLTITDNISKSVTNIPLSGYAYDPLITSFPYTQNFDSITEPDLPMTWSAINTTGNPDAYVETSNSNYISSPNSACLFNDTTLTGELMLVSPPTNLDISNTRVKFYARTSTGIHDLIIGTLSDRTDPSTFVELTTLELDDTWREYAILMSSFSKAETYIAFKHGMDSPSDWFYIDNFIWDEPTNPEISVAPSSIEFGNVIVGSYSEPSTVSITNIGAGEAQISSINFSGTNPNDFSLSESVDFPINLPSGNTFQFQVEFLPLANGVRSANMDIMDNLSKNISSVSLQGTGHDINITNWDYAVINPSASASASAIDTALTTAGKTGGILTFIPTYNDIANLDAVYLTLGIYDNNHVLSEAEFSSFKTYLDNGGRMYAEGGDMWYWDPNHNGSTSILNYFGINGLNDGSSDLATISGVTNSWAEGLSAIYSGENNYIDHIEPNLTGAYAIFENSSPNYTCGVAHHSQDRDATYKTIGTSFEIGGTNNDFILSVHDFLTNDGPTIIDDIDEIKINVNQNYDLDLTTIFSGNSLSFVSTGSSHLNVNIAGNDATIIPDTDWYGSELVSITATDLYGQEAEITFSVIVLNIQTLTYNFNEENMDLYPDWSITHNGSTEYPWQKILDSAKINRSRADSSMKVMNQGFFKQADEWLVTKSFNFNGLDSLSISFWQDFNTNGTSQGIVSYSIDNGFSWNPLYTVSSDDVGQVVIDLNTLSGQSSIKFRWRFVSEDSSDNHWNIDDIVLRYFDPGDVDVISNLTVSGFNENSVTLNWDETSTDYFSNYTIYYSVNATVDTLTADSWSMVEDPNLGNIETTSTTITNLPEGIIHAVIVSKNSFGRQGDVSNEALADVNFAPVLSNPFPANQPYPVLIDNRTVTIGISVFDANSGVDNSSIQYRYDANGNGIYDAEEIWQNAVMKSKRMGNQKLSRDDVSVQVDVTANADGDIAFEFRAKDLLGNGYAYSGNSQIEGIGDDYIVRIDTQSPIFNPSLLCLSTTTNTVTLEWSSIASDNHFMQYEIYYGQNSPVSLTDNLWDGLSDLDLYDINTTYTTVTGVDNSSDLYFAVCAVDSVGNRSSLSNEAINVGAALPPTCNTPYPVNQPEPAWSVSRTVEIGVTFEDEYGIDTSSIQYRYDKNGNGIYDDGSWQDVTIPAKLNRENRILSTFANARGVRSSSEEVRCNVTYEVDGEALHFEFRAKDIHGFGYTYSGTSSIEGIGDDYLVRIDTTPPATIAGMGLGNETHDSFQVAWNTIEESLFDTYEIYYSTEAGVTEEDILWDKTNDPALANVTTWTTTITGLQPYTEYFVRIRARDTLGRTGDFTAESSITTIGQYAPIPPENITLETVGNDVQLSWDAVLYDTDGNEIPVGSYKIYNAAYPDFAIDSNFLLTTVETTEYFHEDVLINANKMFYKVVAVPGYSKLGKSSFEIFKK